MKKRYYIDGKVFGSEHEMPKKDEFESWIYKMSNWINSLVELQCDPSELQQIQSYHQMTMLRNEPIDVTEITEVKDGNNRENPEYKPKVYFKEVDSESQDSIMNSLLTYFETSGLDYNETVFELCKQFTITRKPND